MSRTFNPGRLGVPARALYRLLSDGEWHHVDEARYAITRAVPMDVASAYKSGKSTGSVTDRVSSGRREVARIALLVAVRDGWVMRDGDRMKMSDQALGVWNSWSDEATHRDET